MSDIFDLDQSFESLGLNPDVLAGIEEAGFQHPTVIQSTLIQPILAGKDVLGQAKTGSGKTAAFSLPLLHMANKDNGIQGLVLAPTRELAMQIVTEIHDLGKHTSIRAIAVTGGASYKSQINKIARSEGQIIVGTPGRVMDLHGKGHLPYDKIKWAVLDEVDRMLDIGFRDDIKKILGRIRHEHQTIFVSATISEEIERLGRNFMKEDAEKICTVADSLTVNAVVQKYVPVQPWDKRRMLKHLLTHEEAALTVVFCRTKRTVAKVTSFLNRNKIESFEIHGDLPQGKRNRIMKQLRAGNLEVLVASDLASRGLDVEGITHIINFDLPDDPEVYVHRIGRTARAGRSGTAWSFVEPDQGQLLTEIEKLTSVHIEKLDYPDFKPTEQPENWKPEDRGGRKTPPPPVAPERTNRFEAEKVKVNQEGKVDASMFPSGIVPKSGPKKSLGSRFRTKRGR